MLLEFNHVTGVNKKFRKKFVLQDISFSLPPGYIMGLCGGNGAGKTTLIDYIMNPHQQYEGVIRINGEDIRKNHSAIMNKIGFISEENNFFENLTIGTHEKLLSRFYDNWDKALFHTLLTKMELTAGKVVGNLSRGEFMKFQMAFAAAHHPVLYLLDEVTAGMDPVFRIDFFKLLNERIATEQASVLMTSHIKEEISRKIDYVGVMEYGKMIQFKEVGAAGYDKARA